MSMSSTDVALFQRLDEIAKREGGGIPRLLIDLPRLDANVDLTVRLLGKRALRIVVKSLPSIELLRRVADRAGTRRFMCFHWPFLLQLARAFPDADVMLGKPMPVTALAAFFDRPMPDGFDAAKQIAWLIDDQARLTQYLELARSRRINLRVAIELDVGLHRGGLDATTQLAPMLDCVREHRQSLTFTGFMGYDAHAARAPWPNKAMEAVRGCAAQYAAFVAYVRENYRDLTNEPLLLNGAGSPTLSLHDSDSPLNDISLGSALVKPTDFDVPSLADFVPAAWIATPVLKRASGMRIPFMERWSRLAGKRDTLFIYGGHWMAEPAWPEDMRTNSLYGLSSNQQFMSVPQSSAIRVDDHAFFRPKQSEAVLLEFGNLLAVAADGSVARWPTLSREAP